MYVLEEYALSKAIKTIELFKETTKIHALKI